ncbi:MAG TPA: hypothetical protein VKB42_20340 [Dongiaceae bacterium]|nr:hypothetical protein [Dongiaceae bacterium]
MRITTRGLTTIALAGLLGACAQKPVAPTIATAPQQRYSHLVASNADVTFEITGTSLPGDKDYIPQNDRWVQYLIRVKNTGPVPVRFVNAHLVDGNGIYHDQPQNLDEMYASTADATSAGLGVLGQIAGIFVPYAGTATGLASAAQGPMAADAKAKYMAALKQRLLPAETLDPGAEDSGSFFFPISYKPQAVVFDYSVNGAAKTLRLPLAPAP